MFNFDIVVIIIVLYAIINGLMLGGYRQLLLILNIFIPSVIIFFTTPIINDYLSSLPAFNKVINGLYNVLKIFINLFYC